MELAPAGTLKGHVETVISDDLTTVYSVEDLRGGSPSGTAGELLGEHPFTRGIRPTMHRSRVWTMRKCGRCRGVERYRGRNCRHVASGLWRIS